MRPPKLLVPSPTSETSGPAISELALSCGGRQRSTADVIGRQRRHIDELRVVGGQRPYLHRAVEPDENPPITVARPAPSAFSWNRCRMECRHHQHIGRADNRQNG